MDEFIEEGRAATDHTLTAYSQSWKALSCIAEEVVANGMYVPMFLPKQDTSVLLIAIRDANTLQAKSLHRSCSEMLIAIAQHTGESCRDDIEGCYTDFWRLDQGRIQTIDCAKDAVYWLPLPEQWQEVNFMGMGSPFLALTADDPVFKHLCFQSDTSSLRSPTLDDPVYLRTAIEWQTKEK